MTQRARNPTAHLHTLAKTVDVQSIPIYAAARTLEIKMVTMRAKRKNARLGVRQQKVDGKTAVSMGSFQKLVAK